MRLNERYKDCTLICRLESFRGDIKCSKVLYILLSLKMERKLLISVSLNGGQTLVEATIYSC